MSIKKGNELLKQGNYDEAIESYEQIEKNSPLFQWAQKNIEIARRIQERRGTKQKKEPETEDPAIGIETDFRIEKLAPVKGLDESPAIVCRLKGLKNKEYYRITLLCEERTKSTISVRDKTRNIPIYQSAPVDINAAEVIFLVPPSAKSEITLSIHPIEKTTKLDELSKKIILSIEKIATPFDKAFRPSQAQKPIVASMATIESRLGIAIDAVYSLLAQVDRVHIHLNDTNKIPDQLKDERIVVTTESSHGNIGDAGKFIGIKNEGDIYALVCDDDFIYPFDFTIQSYIRLASENFKAVIGLHGIFLRYPLEDYYASDARNTMHITTGFSFETITSATGTGAVFFDTHHLPIRNNFNPDFKNMADIWFAIECSQNRVPIIIQKRHTNWIIDNPPPEASNSIWKHSASNSQSSANTRAMQTYVLNSANGFLCASPSNASKLGKDYILIIDFESLKKNATQIEKISKTEFSPGIIVVQNCTDTTTARKLTRAIYCDILISEKEEKPEKISKAENLNKLSFALQVNGHLELSEEKIRTLVTLFREKNTEIKSKLKVSLFLDNLEDPCSICYAPITTTSKHWTEKTDARISAPITEKILGIFGAQNSKNLETISAHYNQKTQHQNKILKISEYFDRIYLLNLDRRPDRLKQFKDRAMKWAINFERVSAVDGSLEGTRIEYEKIQKTLKEKYGLLNHQFKYESSSYWEYSSEGERISHLLKKNGKTYSSGGYGYLKTYKSIIEDAISKNYERIAVFDDDCLFHKQLDLYFSRVIEEIPEDWVTLSLGSLQYEWRDKYIGWWTPNAYRCGGHSVGSHAQAYSKTAFPMLLENIERYTLPFDVGALHYLKRYYSTKSFTAFPNLFIQDVADTDIGDSSVQLAEGAKMKNIYKWELGDYE